MYITKNITNKAPIVPERNSNANLESGNDVYYKGAHALHMLRYIIGKETLWASLKEYLQMPKELPDNQTSTDEFISLIEENSGMKLDWFFNQYFFKKELPTLRKLEKTIKNKKYVDLWWEEVDFKMPIEINYFSFDGKRYKKLVLDNKPKRFVIPSESDLVIDPNRWLLYK